jgi:hypothetical protein
LVYHFICISSCIVIWIKKAHLLNKRQIIAASRKDLPMPETPTNQPMQSQPTPKPSREQQKQANEQADAKTAPAAKVAPADKA